MQVVGNGSSFSGQRQSWGPVTGISQSGHNPSFTVQAGTPNTIGPTETLTGLKNELPGPTMATADHAIQATLVLPTISAGTHSARIMVRYTDSNNYIYAQIARDPAPVYLRQLIQIVASVSTTLYTDSVDPGSPCVLKLMVKGSVVKAEWIGSVTLRVKKVTTLLTGTQVGIRTGSDTGIPVSEVQFKDTRGSDITSFNDNLPWLAR